MNVEEMHYDLSQRFKILVEEIERDYPYATLDVAYTVKPRKPDFAVKKVRNGKTVPLRTRQQSIELLSNSDSE